MHDAGRRLQGEAGTSSLSPKDSAPFEDSTVSSPRAGSHWGVEGKNHDFLIPSHVFTRQWEQTLCDYVGDQ